MSGPSFHDGNIERDPGAFPFLAPELENATRRPYPLAHGSQAKAFFGGGFHRFPLWIKPPAVVFDRECHCVVMAPDNNGYMFSPGVLTYMSEDLLKDPVDGDPMLIGDIVVDFLNISRNFRGRVFRKAAD